MKIDNPTDSSQNGARNDKSIPMQVQAEEETCVFNGHLRINRYLLTHELYNGSWSQPIQREVMCRNRAVGVLLFDPYRQEIVLIEQFRIGAWSAGEFDPWLLECVAGLVEDNEHPEEVAIRETLEESGCTLLRLTPIINYFTTPGCSNEQIQLFCGQIDATGVGGHHGIDEEGEDIRVNAWPIDDALNLIGQGRVCNSMTIIALQWLTLNHMRLTIDWTNP